MLRSKIRDGIIGLCVGDALGVPVEFQSRHTLRNKPLTDMIGYGTHNQPAGTWSDDSSLVFCLMESAAAFPQVDLYDIAERFVMWLDKNEWTPHGVVFDRGIATASAIERYKDLCIRPDLAGGISLNSNGNGSLMRILPLAYWFKNETATDRKELVSKISSITHGHPISKIACVIYVELAIHLIEGRSLAASISSMQETVLTLYKDEQPQNMKPFERMLKGDLALLDEGDIESSGYVVHTLEASLWCLLKSSSYTEAVLRAVNLGEDTDTTGAVAGGLAGLLYGEEAIPIDWIRKLARLDDIQNVCNRFEEAIRAAE